MKFLKIVGGLFVLFFIGIFLYGYSIHKPLPQGTQSKEADVLATKMLTALNKKAYDNTKILEWTFKGDHHYKWFKEEGKAEVTWENNKVLLDLKKPQNSIIYTANTQTENNALLDKAINYFNNDSFWLVAPYKVFDEGTKRAIVKYNDQNALLITYTSGGSTPGDSYLWILDNNYLPVAYEMWVDIIPIGGLKATWDSWITTETGCKLPTKHKLSAIGFTLEMENVKGY